jgi:Spy/CpxP family protein refolding chaperone
MVSGALGRSRWLALGVLSATFVAGAMLGAAALRVLADDRAEQPERGRRDDRREDRGPPPSIFDQMGLTAAQKVAMDSIMEKRRREMDAFWKQHNPEVRAIIDSTRAEIDRLLTPEQRKQFQEFRERRRREHSDRDGRQGARPGPGGFGRAAGDQPPRAKSI